jgi:hypothetical protein
MAPFRFKGLPGKPSARISAVLVEQAVYFLVLFLGKLVVTPLNHLLLFGLALLFGELLAEVESSLTFRVGQGEQGTAEDGLILEPAALAYPSQNHQQ